MQHIDAELYRLLEGVSVISRRERFDLEDLEKLTGLYNQAAYLFTYIEGNAKYVDTGVFLTVKAALLDDVELRGRLASRARGLMAEMGSVPGRWTDAIDWFRRSPEQVRAEAETRAAIGGVQDVLTRIDHDRAALLARLGMGNGAGQRPKGMAAVMRSIADPAARSKVLLAWYRLGENHAAPLAEAMDRLVDQRWRQATTLGYRSVAERGFASCGVSTATAKTFLEAYTSHALLERRAFLSRFKGASGLDDNIRALDLLSSGRHERRASGPAAVGFSALLELITDTIQRVFGINFSARPGYGGAVGGFHVTQGPNVLGALLLDRFVMGASAQVIDPDGCLAPAEQPSARILCLIDRQDTSCETVSFEGARLILHAVGHALIHLVARPRAPSVSGLDTLPLERLEGLSHWFEGLMDDGVFEDRVAVSPEQRAALKAFREARDDRARNTRLEQAVVATIDLNIHERPDCRVRDAFDGCIAGLGGSVGVSFERALRFMSAPLFRDHPGMGFVYPWGAAFAATQAYSAHERSPPLPCLAAYFDTATPISVPDPSAEVWSVKSSYYTGGTSLPHSCRYL